jgi:starch-binding outer membrane protein, SusD/RagB family
MTKYIIAILIPSVILAGCSKDFLDVTPPSELTGAAYFRNEADAAAIVTAAYKPLIATGDLAKISEAPLKDIVIFNTQGLNLDSWSFDANDAIIDRVWQNAYEGVFRANLIIQEVPQIAMEEATKNRMVGEGRFLRAYYYWQLTTLFGDVPLITEADPSDPKKAAVAKSPVSDIYNVIIDDLTQAVGLLPESYDGKNVGRATKGAAQALLGKVYLYAKNYPLAEEALQTVINPGTYSLISDFSQLLITDNNPESLFEIQFADIAGQGSDRVVNDYPQGQGGFANLLPSQTLVDAFEDYDGATSINGKDPRLFYSIFRQDDPYDAVSPLFQQVWTPTGFARKKGMFPVIRQNNSNSGRNFPLIRYADVLLMYAEAANENDHPIDAVDAINKVRQRVGMPDLPTVQFPTGTKAEIFNAIVHERQVELAFEYHRLNDLRRWGLAEQELSAVGYQSPKHRYFPIPQQELNTNPELVQNEGY